MIKSLRKIKYKIPHWNIAKLFPILIWFLLFFINVAIGVAGPNDPPPPPPGGH
ncbi:MAG: hypothetical protein ACW964_01635 [Candidatus Hodarchaeales archaeon]|jgi:hypothetical protein